MLKKKRSIWRSLLEVVGGGALAGVIVDITIHTYSYITDHSNAVAKLPVNSCFVEITETHSAGVYKLIKKTNDVLLIQRIATGSVAVLPVELPLRSKIYPFKCEDMQIQEVK